MDLRLLFDLGILFLCIARKEIKSSIMVSKNNLLESFPTHPPEIETDYFPFPLELYYA